MDKECYLYVGPLLFQRQRLGKSAIAVLDPSAVETDPAAPVEPVIMRFSDMTTDFTGGIRGTIGFRQNELGLEFTGFYVPNSGGAKNRVIPGQLDSFFFNEPAGFAGDNGLWLHADRIRAGFRNSLQDAEFNLRTVTRAYSTPDLILGLRYLGQQEELNIFTDDDGITNPPLDPTLAAFYIVRTHNRLVGPQIGTEGGFPILPGTMLTFMAKAMVAANFAHTDILLVRVDNLVGFFGQRDHTVLSFLGEVGLFLDFWVMDKIRVRAGYDFLYLGGVATAEGQVDFDLSHTLGRQDYNGSTFYHGPILEFQFSF